ncbi:twin-arginine translocation signal domain-containing protein [Megasphaera elsdenii]
MPGDIHAFSRRTFLKMAAGTAVGAALFSMPALSKQSLTPVPYPACTSTCAKMNRMGKISLLRQWPKLS